MTSVVITGLGAVGPFGTDDALAAVMQRPAVGGAAGDVLAADLLPEVRSRVVRAERSTQLMVRAAARTLAAAGQLPEHEIVRREVGVVIGTAFGCLLSNEAHQARVRTGGPASASPRMFAATVSNAAAGEVGIAFRLGGPAATITTGAASGLAALVHARATLAAGRGTAMLAGGGDALGPVVPRWLAAAGLDTHPPSEAAALVMLETADAAVARGVPALATLLGGALGFDAEPHRGVGLARTIEAAVADAGVDAGSLAVVVRAAPPSLRAMEARCLAPWVDEREVHVLPVKSHLGESFGAAGPLGAMVALHALALGGMALLVDVCGTGHLAAVVLRREAA